MHFLLSRMIASLAVIMNWIGRGNFYAVETSMDETTPSWVLGIMAKFCFHSRIRNLAKVRNYMLSEQFTVPNGSINNALVIECDLMSCKWIDNKIIGYEG